MTDFIERIAVAEARRRKMPAQKPGKSRQDYATPRAFLDAIKEKFSVKAWAWDLAANKSNEVTGANLYFGPDRSEHFRDSLAQDWTKFAGDLWLNPPFADIAPWAEKCAASASWAKIGVVPCGRRIFFLVPAAVGSNWFANYVDGKALVVFPSPRLSFDGKNSYPKDVLLALYGEKPGYACWRWKK